MNKDDLREQVARMQTMVKSIDNERKSKSDENGRLMQEITQLRQGNQNGDAITNETLANVVQNAVTTALADVQVRLAELEKLTSEVVVIKEENHAMRLAAVQQQRFIEYLEGKGRIENLVFFGLPENAIEGVQARTDDEKCKAVLRVIDPAIRAPDGATRVGRAVPGRARPLILPMGSKAARDKVLEKTASLKNHGADDHPFRKVYVKKDIHPAVSKEWKRIHDLEKTEKEKPGNQGVEIRFDKETRQLLRDGVVIDRFSPPYFQ